jgi:hypothetical protein
MTAVKVCAVAGTASRATQQKTNHCFLIANPPSDVRRGVQVGSRIERLQQRHPQEDAK